MWNSYERPNAEVVDPRSASGLQFSTNLSNGSNNHLFPSPSLRPRSQHSAPPSIVSKNQNSFIHCLYYKLVSMCLLIAEKSSSTLYCVIFNNLIFFWTLSWKRAPFKPNIISSLSYFMARGR